MPAREKDSTDIGPMTEIRVLGPLMLRINSRTITPHARKPRQLLALLLLNIDRFVPVPYLLNGLWGDQPPRSAVTTLQTYILQLRNSLSDIDGIDARDVLVTMDGGYLFSLRGAEFDLERYQRLVSEGIAALRAGQDDDARQSLDTALRLWHGDALADVRFGRVLENEAIRLEESRLRTIEHRIEADLRLGRHWEILEELSTLSVQHPLHENLHLQYMLALHRSGHRLDALRVFHRLRAALVRDVGMEPTAKLQQLQQLILTSEPTTDDRREEFSVASLVVPEHNIPAMNPGT